MASDTWGNFLPNLGKALEQTFTGPAALYEGGPTQPEYSLPHPKQEEAAAKEGEAKEKAKAASAASTKAYEQEIKNISASPWTTAANALAANFQSDLQAVQPDISGASGAQAMQGAASAASADLGLPAMSPGAAWLAQGATDAQAQTQGVSNAMNAEGQSYANAGNAIANAVQQYGEANAIGEETAPEQAWLSALGSHITSNLSYQGQVPKADVVGLPPALASALQQSGGYPGSTGSGLVPLQNITAGKGGTSTIAPTSSGGSTSNPTLGPEVPPQ